MQLHFFVVVETLLNKNLTYKFSSKFYSFMLKLMEIFTW